MTRKPWIGSTRRSRLPADWAVPGGLRDQVLDRDGGVCRLQYDGCLLVATDVDHKQPGDDHRLSNLQAACRPCHRTKSGREGAAARPPLRRPPEVHPSLK